MNGVQFCDRAHKGYVFEEDLVRPAVLTSFRTSLRLFQHTYMITPSAGSETYSSDKRPYHWFICRTEVQNWPIGLSGFAA
jgi:hypothetical protein